MPRRKVLPRTMHTKVSQATYNGLEDSAGERELSLSDICREAFRDYLDKIAALKEMNKAIAENPPPDQPMPPDPGERPW